VARHMQKSPSRILSSGGVLVVQVVMGMGNPRAFWG
jgi:hypothetical protein